MNFNNLILAELLDDDIVQINFIKLLIEEELNQLLLPNNLDKRGIRQKNENYYEEIVPLYSTSLFKEHFRMSRTAIDELVNIIGNAMIKNQNQPVDLTKKVLFTIWILAKQESYLAAGDRFNIAKSTGHSIVKEIVSVLTNLIPNFIVWPDMNKCNISSSVFQQRSNGFPGVIGAIDGCHIQCKAPAHNANDFYNRKGFHSIILQGVCDHKARFINIFIGLPGRMHDSCVFRYSTLYRQMRNTEQPVLPPQLHLIADAAYPLLINLMTPFRDTGHLSKEQLLYNTKLSCIRSIIERTFGFLKGKFRRLRYLDINDFELGQKMIGAACVLHNFMIDKEELNIEEDRDIENEILLNIADNEYPDVRNAMAIAKRNNIMYQMR
ncbi:putative nuclease HARBI1 [Pseudomyrmex gracilis]|uniref:putative nuclease HARBI1 n=1 Tax=Pseudomyrmex gracilis TaxID=219809 RepID=UPI00099555E6|nr:putative nuclease HARBI1 [Pseudomyrmex gracilis]